MPFSGTSIKAQIDHLRTGLKGHRSSKDLYSQHNGSPDISPVDKSNIPDVICISPVISQEDDDVLCASTLLGGLPLEYNESSDYHFDAALASFSSSCEIGAGAWEPTSATEEGSMLCSPLSAFSGDSSGASGAFNTSPILTDDYYQPYGTASDSCLDDFQYPPQTPLNMSIDEYGLSSSPRASFAAPQAFTGLARRLGLPISAYSGTTIRAVKSVSVYSLSASPLGLSYIEAGSSEEDSGLKQTKRQRRDSPYLGGFSFSDDNSHENTVDKFLSTHKSRRSCLECPCIPRITKRQTIWSSSLGLTPTILDALVEQRDQELDYELDDLYGSPTPYVASTDCILGKTAPPLIVPAYRLSFEQLLDFKFNMDSVQVARQNSDLTCDNSHSAVSANSSASASPPATEHADSPPLFFSLSDKHSRNREADVSSMDQNEYEKYVLTLPSPGPLVPVHQGGRISISDLPDIVISQSSTAAGTFERMQVDPTRQSSSSRTYDSFDYLSFSLPDIVTSAHGSVNEGPPASRAGNIFKHTSESTSKLKHFASRLFKRRTINSTNHHLPQSRRYGQISGPLDDFLLDVEGGTDTGWLTLVQEGWEVLPS
ncbi:hypothetical protein D9619_001254 [Psilocybe cf. subviscida]|uniref:Uncharacterized protein n=1 Tax=Psilocybe cf. subviscida TaxID=2480587 RepID=A0A8H5BGB7_9AGAR|nr:hypothetical protein D9619_001254 [Psilocybe cf. subviscida]